MSEVGSRGAEFGFEAGAIKRLFAASLGQGLFLVLNYSKKCNSQWEPNSLLVRTAEWWRSVVYRQGFCVVLGNAKIIGGLNPDLPSLVFLGTLFMYNYIYTHCGWTQSCTTYKTME